MKSGRLLVRRSRRGWRKANGLAAVNGLWSTSSAPLPGAPFDLSPTSPIRNRTRNLPSPAHPPVFVSGQGGRFRCFCVPAVLTAVVSRSPGQGWPEPPAKPEGRASPFSRCDVLQHGLTPTWLPPAVSSAWRFRPPTASIDLALEMLRPPHFVFQAQTVGYVIRCEWHTPAVFTPVSCSWRIPMICSSVNPLFFTSVSLKE